MVGCVCLFSRQLACRIGYIEFAMYRSRKTRWVLLVFTVALGAGCVGPVPNVNLLRAPEGASLPQIVIDTTGTLHLVYYAGSMSSGDLFHVTRGSEASEWSAPQRVNSQALTIASRSGEGCRTIW